MAAAAMTERMRQRAANPILRVLMNTRVVELVVFNIGVETVILPPLLCTMLTLMALITTALTLPLLEYLGFSKYTLRS